MTWTADEIKQLRYRLGWSQAEMARCLKIDLSVLTQWEAGRQPGQVSMLQDEQKSALARIYYQAESNAEKIHRLPIAEVIMKTRGLSQIHDLDVIDSLSEKSSETKGNE